MVKEEPTQHLIQSSVHFQSSWCSHQPLEQVLQLFSYTLQTQKQARKQPEIKDVHHTKQVQCMEPDALHQVFSPHPSKQWGKNPSSCSADNDLFRKAPLLANEFLLNMNVTAERKLNCLNGSSAGSMNLCLLMATAGRLTVWIRGALEIHGQCWSTNQLHSADNWKVRTEGVIQPWGKQLGIKTGQHGVCSWTKQVIFQWNKLCVYSRIENTNM